MSLDPKTRGTAATGRYERFLAKAEADRARKAAGTKSAFARLCRHLWPHRREASGGQESAANAFDEPDR